MTLLMILLTIASIFLCNSCKLHLILSSGNTTVDELMMRLMGAMEIFTAQQQEDIKDEVRIEYNQGTCSETVILRHVEHALDYFEK